MAAAAVSGLAQFVYFSLGAHVLANDRRVVAAACYCLLAFMIYGNFVEEKLIIQQSFLRALHAAASPRRRRIAADASQLLHSFSAQIRHADDEHIYFGRIPPLSRQQFLCIRAFRRRFSS